MKPINQYHLLECQVESSYCILKLKTYLYLINTGHVQFRDLVLSKLIQISENLKSLFKIPQARLQQYVNHELPDV